MKIALVCIAKNENKYFDEWVRHHLKIGFDHVLIYDNNSKEKIEIASDIKEKVKIIFWRDTDFGSQSRCYMSACKEYGNQYSYMAFFDVDEFYQSKTMNVKDDLIRLGLPVGLGIYWRIYGNPQPFKNRQAMSMYKNWYGDKHIKSILIPTHVHGFPDPHKAVISFGDYIDENGKEIVSPIGQHTSNDIWIKHIFTRSKTEFAEKIERGDANTRVKNRTWADFDHYNSLCINQD
jgi:hypothetical protein